MNSKQTHHTPKKQADIDYQAAMQSYFSRPDYLLTHPDQAYPFAR
jgi:hypothetical protein